MKTFSIGDQVEHKLFGKGTILTIEDVKNSAKLTIRFSGNISKMLISKYPLNFLALFVP